MFDVTLTHNFQHQIQFVDSKNITRRDQRKNLKITDNTKYILSIHTDLVMIFPQIFPQIFQKSSLNMFQLDHQKYHN